MSEAVLSREELDALLASVAESGDRVSSRPFLCGAVRWKRRGILLRLEISWTTTSVLHSLPTGS